MNLLEKMRETFALTDFEARKIFRQKKCLAGLAVNLLLTLLVLVGFYLRKTGAIKGHRQEFEGRLITEFINGTSFCITVLLPAIYMIMPMVLAMMAASVLAGEQGNGTLRMMSVRPISRWNVVISKLLAVTLYSLFLLSCLFATSMALGSLFFGYGGDIIVFGPAFIGKGAGIFIMDSDTAMERAVLAYFFCAYSLLSLSAMFIMSSVIFRNATTAAIVPLGIYYTSYILDALPLMESIQRFLPTRYLMLWKYTMAQEIMWDRMLSDGIFLAIYTLLYVIIAGFVFNGSDL